MLHHRNTCHCADQAFVGELFHQLDEPPAFVGSEEVLRRDPQVVEEQFGGVLALLPDLVQHASALESRCVVGYLGDEQRQARRPRLRISLRGDDHQVAVAAVGYESLCAGDEIAVSGLGGARADGLQVGSGSRLGHRDGTDPLPRRQLRQPTLFLLFGAVGEDVVRNNTGVHAELHRAVTGADLLLEQDRFVGEGAAASAVFLRDRHAQKPQIAGSAVDGSVGITLLDELRLERRHFLGEEVAGEFANGSRLARIGRGDECCGHGSSGVAR